MPRAGKIAIVVVGAAVLGLLAAMFLRDPRPAVPPEPVAVGDELPIDELDLDGVHPAVLVALSPDCQHCADSMQFFRELVFARNRERGDLQVVALVAERGHLGRESTALATAGVPVDNLLAADFEELGIPGTPYLVLVDPSGRVDAVWSGSVDAERGARILASLGLR